MIERLVLENWKTHKNSEFAFGKGTNVLVGVMGSGKTSVTDALSFALFGTFPALQSRRVSIEETIMARPEKAERARLQLEFCQSEKKYLVERIVFRGGKASEAKLYCENRLVAGPKPSSVNEKIEETLQVGFDLFSRAVYSEQNQTDYFLRLSPSERKQKFDELLEINKYEKARANAVAISNNLKRIAEEKKSFAREQRKKLETTEIAALQKRLSEKKEKEKVLEEQIAAAEKNEKALLEKAKKLEEKDAEHNFLKELVSKSLGKAEAMEKELARNKKELNAWKGKSLESELKELEKKEKELSAQCKQNENAIKEARAEQAKLLQAIGATENQLQQTKKAMLELEKAKANCPVCKRELQDRAKKEIVQHYEKEISFLLAEKEKAEKQKSLLEESIEKKEEHSEKQSAKTEELKGKAIELKNLLKSASVLEKQEKELALLKEETAKAEKALKALGFEERALSQLREQKANAAATARALKSELQGNKEIERELLERIEEFKKLEQQLKELEESAKRTEQIVEKLALFTNCLVATQSELRETLIEATNQAMQDIWEKIYPYKDYSNAKILVDKKGDYELVARTRLGEWVRVEGILSGGERSAAAICIRIAFSLILTQNLSWLILDEPTHNLDSQAVAVLSEMMKLHLPKLVEQIFVITHDKQLEKAASASLYLLERDKDNDGCTVPTLKEID